MGSFIKAFIILAILAFVFWQIWKRDIMKPVYGLVIGWMLLLVLWTHVAIPVIDHMKTLQPFFTRIGTQLTHTRIIGYDLAETVEALSPFYGGFYIDNIENRDIFSNLSKTGTASYVWVLPARPDTELKRLISLRYQLIDSVDAGGRSHRRIRKNVQLWKIKEDKN